MSKPQLESFYTSLKKQTGLKQFIHRKRDLLILDLYEGFIFVVACDSNSSIGLKEHDSLKREYGEVGRCAVKVPLMEVLATGAMPFAVIDNLCVEMEPSGVGILEGVRFEVMRLGLDPDLVINGSSEKNMPTNQTGVGITVIGLCKKEEFHISCSLPGDMVVCVGMPKSAPTKPFFEGEFDIMDPPTTRRLRVLDYIHEIIPVGSQGVRYEADVLAQESGIKFKEIVCEVDMAHSAGPSTCVLASLNEDYLYPLKKAMTHPVNPVGYLV